MNQDPIQLRLKKWLMRTNPKGAIRQVAQAPLVLSSDIGRVRAENQDRVAVLRAKVSPTRSFLVAVLCDGMGGMLDGAGCASSAVSAFLTSCIRNRTLEPSERLQVAVESANNCVFREYNQKGGATLSAFLIDTDQNFAAVNIGDSRIYSFSDNKLQQMSKDDTLAGQFGQADKPMNYSNQLLQYIGMGEDLDPHFISMPDIDSDSKILMTSDGTHFVDQSTMESILRYADNPAEIGSRLIALAKWCGGKDNASIVVAEKLSTILSADNEDAPTGSVQIWDSFGDLQLIGVEKVEVPPVRIQLAEDSEKESPLALDGETIKDDEEDGKKLNKSQRQSKAKKGKKEGSKSKNEEKQPQIRIDFE